MDSVERQWRHQEVHEVAAQGHGIITADELSEIGLVPSTVSTWCRAGRLVRVAPRSYLVPDLRDDRSHLAAVCRSAPLAVASHRAAARLWGLDGIDVDVVEVSIPHRTELRRGVVHRTLDLRNFDVTEVDGIRCTTPARTLIDLGAVVADDVVERALESALRLGLCSVARLEWRLQDLARKGRPGPASLRRVLARRPEGAPPTESDLETLFIQCLRSAGVPEPVRQHPIRLPDGRIARLDLAYPAPRLFVELDGWASHGTRQAFERDRSRQNAAVLLGWRPLRFTWSLVTRHGPRVAAEVAVALASAAA